MNDITSLQMIYENILRDSNDSKPLAPAVFLGWNENPFGDDLELWNLTEDIEGHPKSSTVTRETLENRGFYVPEPDISN